KRAVGLIRAGKTIPIRECWPFSSAWSGACFHGSLVRRRVSLTTTATPITAAAPITAITLPVGSSGSEGLAAKTMIPAASAEIESTLNTP
ncbi:MAG TPA: hypothetical protein VL371_08365, partial [Gemmataceae bacterium]|nr:hypothetical protein [Gemmataceae bacterium]